MPFPVSASLVPRLVELDSSSSTNDELARLAQDGDLLPFTTLVTRNQTAGRGRLGRNWVAPPDSALAVSVLLAPATTDGLALSTDRFAWLPIAAGVAMTAAVAELLPGAQVGFKWPNDVLVGDRKVCGILAEVLAGARSVVMGSGVNVSMSADQLPVPTATSLHLEGAAGDDVADRVLAGYLRRLISIVGDYARSGGDADASGLRAAALELCTTIGRRVRVELPGGNERSGVAVGIDALGRLELRDESTSAITGRVEAIAAGDIVHLR